MNQFIKKVLVLCIFWGSTIAFADPNCRTAYSPLTEFDPKVIGARPSDLKTTISEIEASVVEAELSTEYTSDRLAIIYARAWIEAAKNFVGERERNVGDLPNTEGGFFLGLSRLGEARLLDSENLTPFDFKIKPAMNGKADLTKLKFGESISEETVIEMITIFQNQGVDALRSYVTRRTKPMSDADLIAAAKSGEELAYSLAVSLLREGNIDLGGINTANLTSRRSEIRDALVESTISKFRNNEKEKREQYERLADAIINNPDFKIRDSEPGSVEQFLLSEIGSFTPNEAFNPLRVNDSIPVEIYNVLKDFRISEKFQEVFANENEGRRPTELEEISEMLNYESYRKRLRSAAIAVLFMMEKNYAQSINKPNAPTPEVDILFIGAGLHEQNMQNYLRLNAKTLTTLTIERTDIPGSTFAVGGKAFNLNSSSKAEDTTSLRQRLGQSDLNFLPGGVAQVNQFSREKNPPAEYFADAIIINRSFSNNPILFNRQVIRVEKNGEKYLVTLSDGTQIITKSVIQTGIGKPSIPESIVGLKEIYERGNDSVSEVDANKPRQVLTYPDFMRFVNGTSKPLTPFANKKVAVVGAGDSGKAIVRWLSIQSNPESYGRDTRKVNQPETIFWYGQECNTCGEFVNQNRSFYADLVGGFKSGRTIAKNKLASVENTADGRLLLKTLETTSELPERITEEVVDYIIVTTGFENPIESIYGNIMADSSETGLGLSPSQFIEQSKNLRIIQGFEPSLGVVGIARQVVNKDGRPEDIYLVGPLAGKIVDPRELKEIEENFVANANHNWRAWRLIEALSIKLTKPLEN